MRRLKNLLFTSAAVFVLALFSVTVIAQQESRQTGSGLQITPTRFELSENPGTTKRIVIGLKNVSGGEIIAKPVINDFESDDETGQPKIVTEREANSPRSISKFVSGIGDLRLKDDETKDTSVTLKIPKDTPAGAYYGVIRYEAIPVQDKDQGNIALTGSVGTIVLLEVKGDIAESMQINYARAELDGKSSKLFVKPPNKAAVEVENTGNSFLKPFGKVSIAKNGKEVYSYELNNAKPRGNILPDSKRIFRDDIHNVSGIGKYTLTASLAFGEGGEVIIQQSTFWMIPLIYIIIAAAVLLILAIAAIIIRRKNR